MGLRRTKRSKILLCHRGLSEFSQYCVELIESDVSWRSEFDANGLISRGVVDDHAWFNAPSARGLLARLPRKVVVRGKWFALAKRNFEVRALHGWLRSGVSSDDYKKAGG